MLNKIPTPLAITLLQTSARQTMKADENGRTLASPPVPWIPSRRLFLDPLLVVDLRTHLKRALRKRWANATQEEKKQAASHG